MDGGYWVANEKEQSSARTMGLRVFFCVQYEWHSNLWKHMTEMGLWMVLKSGKHLKLDNEIF